MKKIILFIMFMMLASFVSAAQVTRDMPNVVQPNGILTVTLAATGTSGKYLTIATENIPTGWTYVSGGSLEGNQIKFILGTITSGTITYQIKAPATSTGLTSISGNYQFAGETSSHLIIGDSNVQVSTSCTPVNGGWSDYGECTNSVKTRTCTDPLPSCGGANCAGSATLNCETLPPTEEDEPYIERDVASSVGLNTEVTIKLTAKDATGKSISLIKENIPTGWTYVSGGSLEGAQVKMFAGSLTSNQATYKLKSPSTAKTSSFSGTYQFAGYSEKTIDGDKSVTVTNGTESKCEMYQTEKDGECVMAVWVYFAAGIAFFAIILLR